MITMQKNNKKTRVDSLSTLRANITFRRESLGISKSQLARAVDVAPQYISEIESGAKVPSLGVLVKVADALDSSPALLFTPDYFSQATVDTP